jgi:cell division septation protein DedD
VPRNDDGEFELILGNRQLMSVFFIVVILLGIFFAMGYIVGRNSSPVGAPEVAARRTDTAASTDTPASTRESTRDTTKETATPAPADVSKEPDSQPKETASQQGPATRPAPPTEPAPAPAPVKAPARAATSGEPQSGKTYLQISAVDRDKAEIYVERLRKQNFSAIMAEIPEKPGVFRVLVGPIAEADINKTRAALQDASFPGKEAVKRTF